MKYGNATIDCMIFYYLCFDKFSVFHVSMFLFSEELVLTSLIPRSHVGKSWE